MMTFRGFKHLIYNKIHILKDYEHKRIRTVGGKEPQTVG